MKPALLIIAIAALLADIAIREAKPQNAGLPLVHARILVPERQMLIAPCPIEPRNFPRWKEREA